VGCECQLGVKGNPEDFGVVAKGKRLSPKGDAQVSPGLVVVRCEQGHMGLGQRNGEASIPRPSSDITGVARQAVGGFRYRNGGSCSRKVISV